MAELHHRRLPIPTRHSQIDLLGVIGRQRCPRNGSIEVWQLPLNHTHGQVLDVELASGVRHDLPPGMDKNSVRLAGGQAPSLMIAVSNTNMCLGVALPKLCTLSTLGYENPKVKVPMEWVLPSPL